METKLFGDIKKTAWVSSCERYRHALGRHWKEELGYVLFIGLNPSTADAEKDDPTIRRCMRFARDWGYGGIEMCNLFDWRATDPKKLPRKEIAVSEKNDPVLRVRVLNARFVVAAWGRVPWAAKRIEQVYRTIFADEKRWHALELLREFDGEAWRAPRHPLYVRSDALPVLFW